MHLKHLLGLAALALTCGAAQADWALPAGASARLGGGTVSMGCASLQNGGTLRLDDGALLAARDVALASGAQLEIGAGRIELAQQWTNLGTATATSGGVTRTASPGCAVVGQAGPVALSPLTPPAPQPVTVPPLPGGTGTTAQVAIGGVGASGAIIGLPSGCTVTQLAIDRTIPPGAPGNASFPLGVLRFEASGCPGAVLQVRATYPAGSLAGLVMQKYGPHGTPVRTGWFSPPGLAVSGDTVSYTVTDGGDGDSDTRAGSISDPFAPMLLAAVPGAGGAQAIPTLGEWGVLLLSTLMALLGAHGVRRMRHPARRHIL
ncbi:IPTL-CTERM sorting domain-containing protein [Acidovorax radicis]|uniref:IPTL-CTERM sorting domain-containing protein n=1 Tax=Acidovorax radicis TaxID=758826 RepID=UPI001CFBE3DD|nr:IPTL-CTERM sorting domain-containing protein [Acidovorax radicis]UCV01069.1 IPTL-CTERM sorting domain-containing protein [Acidovorax radicis]